MTVASARERLMDALLERNVRFLMDTATARREGALLALEAAAEAAEAWFLDHGGKTHEPIAVAEAIRALAEEIRRAE